MSDGTKKNFDDLRDVSPQDVRTQWRFAREASRSPELGVSHPGLAYFSEVDKGGHFAAWEEPELFASEACAAFRSAPLADRARGSAPASFWRAVEEQRG